MRRAALYLAALAVAAVVVFLVTYLIGRHPSLEAELDRLTTPRNASDPGKSGGIPSLQPFEAAPEEPVATQDPTAEPLGAGIVVSRSPLEPAGMQIVVDVPALAAATGEGAPFAAGLAAFFSRPPAGLQIGLRALGGAVGQCDSTDALSGLGRSAGGEVAAALDPASGRGRGPRNPAKAVEAAASDLASVAGERSIVMLTGGAEECYGDICGAASLPGGPGQRIHVLLLASRPQPGSDSGMPSAGSDGTLQPVFEPDWEGPYRCLAERSGGTLASVSSPAELEAALRRLAGALEAAVVVKAFHFAGQEIKGISPGGAAGWGATLRLGTGARDRLIESDLFPTAFSVAPGVYVVKARYGGQERTVAVAVAAGERAEVRVNFETGELFVQALDAAGGEIVGDSTGFRCAWGVDVFPAGSEESRPAASTCSFPGRLELAPGAYRVRARWKGIERVIDEVTVEAGANCVRAVSFGQEDD